MAAEVLVTSLLVPLGEPRAEPGLVVCVIFFGGPARPSDCLIRASFSTNQIRYEPKAQQVM